MATGSKATLFVGDLALFCTEKVIHDNFSRFGEVLEVKIMKSDDPARHLSYGFVRFADAMAANAALLESNGTVLCGRAMRVRWATYKSQLDVIEVKAESSPVHVSFISYQVDRLVTEATLRSLFSQFEEVVDVSIKKSLIDKDSHKQSGYGFVHFAPTPTGVEAAKTAARVLKDFLEDGINYKCSISHTLSKQLSGEPAPAYSVNRSTTVSSIAGNSSITSSNNLDQDNKQDTASKLSSLCSDHHHQQLYNQHFQRSQQQQRYQLHANIPNHVRQTDYLSAAAAVPLTTDVGGYQDYSHQVPSSIQQQPMLSANSTAPLTFANDAQHTGYLANVGHGVTSNLMMMNRDGSMTATDSAAASVTMEGGLIQHNAIHYDHRRHNNSNNNILPRIADSSAQQNDAVLDSSYYLQMQQHAQQGLLMQQQQQRLETTHPHLLHNLHHSSPPYLQNDQQHLPFNMHPPPPPSPYSHHHHQSHQQQANIIPQYISQQTTELLYNQQHTQYNSQPHQWGISNGGYVHNSNNNNNMEQHQHRQPQYISNNHIQNFKRQNDAAAVALAAQMLSLSLQPPPPDSTTVIAQNPPHYLYQQSPNYLSSSSSSSAALLTEQQQQSFMGYSSFGPGPSPFAHARDIVGGTLPLSSQVALQQQLQYSMYAAAVSRSRSRSNSHTPIAQHQAYSPQYPGSPAGYQQQHLPHPYNHQQQQQNNNNKLLLKAGYLYSPHSSQSSSSANTGLVSPAAAASIGYYAMSPSSLELSNRNKKNIRSKSVQQQQQSRVHRIANNVSMPHKSNFIPSPPIVESRVADKIVENGDTDADYNINAAAVDKTLVAGGELAQVATLIPSSMVDTRIDENRSQLDDNSSLATEAATAAVTNSIVMGSVSSGNKIKNGEFECINDNNFDDNLEEDDDASSDLTDSDGKSINLLYSSNNYNNDVDEVVTPSFYDLGSNAISDQQPLMTTETSSRLLLNRSKQHRTSLINSRPVRKTSAASKVLEDSNNSCSVASNIVKATAPTC